MRLLIVLTVLLSLCLGGCPGNDDLKARTEKLAAFSVTLPDGWSTNIPDGLECTRGRCMAGFSRVGGSRSAVTVSVIPSLGKTLRELVDESAVSSASHDAVMTILSQTEDRVEYKGTIKGSEARLVATMDAEKMEVGILMLVGEDEKQLDEVARTVVMANPKLDFGLGAAPAPAK